MKVAIFLGSIRAAIGVLAILLSPANIAKLPDLLRSERGVRLVPESDRNAASH
jgi:hypothetical protein